MREKIPFLFACFSVVQPISHTYHNHIHDPGYDNAMAENSFSILKCECIYRTKLETRAQAKRLIDDYIWFYSHKRLQQSSHMAPLEMRNPALL